MQKTRQGKTKSCKICGKDFYVHPSDEKHDAHDYCSAACWYKALKVINANKREKRICQNCGKEYPYVKSKNGVKFCSPECRYEYWQGENHPKYQPISHVERICPVCKNKFIRPRSWFKYKTAYCSKQCAAEDMKLLTGENARHWKGGYIPYYGPNWREQRRKVRHRDNYICKNCQITETDLGMQMNVHHIRPFREFNGDWRAANKLSNLISLCPNCHKQAEPR